MSGAQKPKALASNATDADAVAALVTVGVRRPQLADAQITREMVKEDSGSPDG